jgi:hypothetical protein
MELLEPSFLPSVRRLSDDQGAIQMELLEPSFFIEWIVTQ